MFKSVLDNYESFLYGKALSWLPSFKQFPSIELQDLIQEMTIAIYIRYGNFDRSRAGWITFINTVITSRMLDLLDEYNTKTRKPSLPFLEFDKLTISSRNGEQISAGHGRIIDIFKYKNYTPTPLEHFSFNEFYRLIYSAVGKVTYNPHGFRNGDGRSFAQHVFDELISPSKKLTRRIVRKCELIEKRVEKNKQRKRRVKFNITEDDLAKHFGVAIPAIKRCIKLIRQTILKTMHRHRYTFNPLQKLKQ